MATVVALAMAAMAAPGVMRNLRLMQFLKRKFIISRLVNRAAVEIQIVPTTAKAELVPMPVEMRPFRQLGHPALELPEISQVLLELMVEQPALLERMAAVVLDLQLQTKAAAVVVPRLYL